MNEKLGEIRELVYWRVSILAIGALVIAESAKYPKG